MKLTRKFKKAAITLGINEILLRIQREDGLKLRDDAEGRREIREAWKIIRQKIPDKKASRRFVCLVSRSIRFQ